MSRFLFNFVLLAVMFFTLTTMPVNKKILDFNFSLEGFKAWEQNRSPGTETPETPQMTEADATMTIGTNYLFEPESVILQVESEGDAAKAAAEIRDKMTLTVYDKDRMVKSLSGVEIPFLDDRLTDESHAELVVNIPGLELPAGHYRLELFSESTYLDPQAGALTVQMSTFAGKRYVPARNLSRNSNVTLQIYYIDESFMHLIPLTQETANQTVLRKTANALAAPPPAGMGLLPQAPAPRVPNIQYANGTVSLYARSSDLEPFSSGSTVSLMAVDAMRLSMFNFDYVQRVRFYVDGRSTGSFLHGMDLSTIYERDSSPVGWVGVRTSADRLNLAPMVVYPTLPTSVEDLFALLKSGITQQGNIDALIAPIPHNVELNSAVQDGNVLNVDLSLEGELYGNDQAWATFMFDAMTQSLTSIPGVSGVRYTLSGTPITGLNGLTLTEIQRKKSLVNPLE